MCWSGFANRCTLPVPDAADTHHRPSAATAALVQAIVATDTDALARRRAVAKAITLLESTRADHRTEADALLAAVQPHAGGALRIGISGVPGVGKSTFIEAFGLMLLERGHRLAVLTVDPSSSVSGGSILGDKTRMERLSVDVRAFIRPSPSSGTLGGVAEKTREAMLVCEAAGHDVVIVETVGVGQSEIAVAGMTDCFVLMQLPNAGDELQAIKKGVVELADIVLVNKADLDPAAATRCEAQLTSTLRLLGQHGRAGHPPTASTGGTATAAARAPAVVRWAPRVLQVSALQANGVEAFWGAVEDFRRAADAGGAFAERRRRQSLAWMWERIDAGLRQAFRAHPAVQRQLPALLQAVAAGQLPASVAARELLAAQSS